MKDYIETEEKLRLSPSSINTYLKCPREFYLTYIKRLPRGKSRHLVKGTVVHDVLEEFYACYEESMEARVDRLFEEVWQDNLKEWNSLKLSVEETRQEREDCRRILLLHVALLQIKMDGLIEGGKAKNKREAFRYLSPSFKELWIEDKELGLCGYIDRVDVDFNGNTKICDYKTSKKYGLGMPEDYRLQCGIYALLYYRDTDILPETVSINYLRYGEEPSIFVTPSLVQDTLQKVQFVRDNTYSRELEDYPMKEQKLCKWCDFFKICSSVEKIEAECRMKEMLDTYLSNEKEKIEKEEKT